MQGSLFDLDDRPAVHRVDVERVRLDERSWVDVQPGFVTGSAVLLEELLAALEWSQGSRILFDREVIEPRLTGGLRRPGEHPAVHRIAEELTRAYGREFDTAFCNLYRDGDDAVAWHRDRIHRTQSEPVVAIVTLGAARRFLLRPRGGGPSVRFRPRSGDLLVMGGRSQHDWEHAVPRSRRVHEPRISVTLRPWVEVPSDDRAATVRRPRSGRP